MIQVRKESVFIKTAVLSTVGVLLVGGLSTYLLRIPIESSVRQEAMREAVAMARVVSNR